MKKLAPLLLIPMWLFGQPQTSTPSCCQQPCTERYSSISLGSGIWDVFPGRKHISQYQVQYTWGASWHGIQPLGAFTFTDRGALYFCFGACYDIFLTSRFVLTPSFTPGIYIRNGGKDLGYPLEFRSSLSLAYECNNRNRIGVQFYHISNASLGHRNPGVECLIFYYSIALW